MNIIIWIAIFGLAGFIGWFYAKADKCADDIKIIKDRLGDLDRTITYNRSLHDSLNTKVNLLDKYRLKSEVEKKILSGVLSNGNYIELAKYSDLIGVINCAHNLNLKIKIDQTKEDEYKVTFYKSKK